MALEFSRLLVTDQAGHWQGRRDVSGGIGREDKLTSGSLILITAVRNASSSSTLALSGLVSSTRQHRSHYQLLNDGYMTSSNGISVTSVCNETTSTPIKATAIQS